MKSGAANDPPMVDDDLWWLWCGDECKGAFVGPHLSPEDAVADEGRSKCEHDHIVLRMSLRQMAAKLPPTAYWWCGSVRDARFTPSRVLIVQPLYPWRSAESWGLHVGEMLRLKREVA
jgi:hypothetical protein